MGSIASCSQWYERKYVPPLLSAKYLPKLTLVLFAVLIAFQLHCTIYSWNEFAEMAWTSFQLYLSTN